MFIVSRSEWSRRHISREDLEGRGFALSGGAKAIGRTIGPGPRRWPEEHAAIQQQLDSRSDPRPGGLYPQACRESPPVRWTSRAEPAPLAASLQLVSHGQTGRNRITSRLPTNRTLGERIPPHCTWICRHGFHLHRYLETCDSSVGNRGYMLDVMQEGHRIVIGA